MDDTRPVMNGIKMSWMTINVQQVTINLSLKTLNVLWIALDVTWIALRCYAHNMHTTWMTLDCHGQHELIRDNIKDDT